MTAAAIFVHGIFSSREVWAPLSTGLRANRDVARAYDFPAFEYSSPGLVLNPKQRRPDLDALADWLRTFLEHECRNHESLVLVGHSQGGLVIQRFLARMLADGRGQDLRRIRSVVLLACPNDGSDFMLLGRRLLLRNRNVQEFQLRPNSEPVKAAQARVLNQIVNARQDSENSCLIPFHVFYGLQDNIVPVASARGPFGEPRALPGDHTTIIAPDQPHSSIVTVLKHLLIDALPVSATEGASLDASTQSQPAATLPASVNHDLKGDLDVHESRLLRLSGFRRLGVHEEVIIELERRILIEALWMDSTDG